MISSYMILFVFDYMNKFLHAYILGLNGMDALLCVCVCLSHQIHHNIYYLQFHKLWSYFDVRNVFHHQNIVLVSIYQMHDK